MKKIIGMNMKITAWSLAQTSWNVMSLGLIYPALRKKRKKKRRLKVREKKRVYSNIKEMIKEGYH